LQIIPYARQTPRALLEEWFPQAAGLITLSQHDEGRPQVLLEAMAARLPVIASNLPAHRDLIRSGETGMLVDSHSFVCSGFAGIGIAG
jgi:glycosyltransferase involved in cell wall biosynthesis